MATWETTGQTQPYVNGMRHSSHTTISKITDKKDGETTFEVNERVTITWGSGVEQPMFFRGTITHEGEVYPVLQSSSGIYYVVGTAGNTLPQRISSALNANTFTVCFFPDTMIATPSGERRVEDLVHGDQVLIESAGAVPATSAGRLARYLCRRLRFRRPDLRSGVMRY